MDVQDGLHWFNLVLEAWNVFLFKVIRTTNYSTICSEAQGLDMDISDAGVTGSLNHLPIQSMFYIQIFSYTHLGKANILSVNRRF